MCDVMPYINLGPIIPPGSWAKRNPLYHTDLNRMYRDLFHCLQRSGGDIHNWHYVDSWNYDLNDNQLQWR